MRRYWWSGGLAVLAVVVLAGCSGDPATAPVTLAPISSSVVTATPSPTMSAPESVPSAVVTPSPSAAVTSSEPSLSVTETPAATTPPWPADFTPEQQAMTQEAHAVVTASWQVLDEIYGDPGTNREIVVRKVMSDPIATQVLLAAQQYSAEGTHSTGSTGIAATATLIQGDGTPGTEITFEVCVDTTGTDLLDATGKSIAMPLPLGPRVKEMAVVYRYTDASGGWLLTTLNPADPYQAC